MRKVEEVSRPVIERQVEKVAPIVKSIPIQKQESEEEEEEKQASEDEEVSHIFKLTFIGNALMCEFIHYQHISSGGNGRETDGW